MPMSGVERHFAQSYLGISFWIEFGSVLWKLKLKRFRVLPLSCMSVTIFAPYIDTYIMSWFETNVGFPFTSWTLLFEKQRSKMLFILGRRSTVCSMNRVLGKISRDFARTCLQWIVLEIMKPWGHLTLGNLKSLIRNTFRWCSRFVRTFVFLFGNLQIYPCCLQRYVGCVVLCK